MSRRGSVRRDLGGKKLADFKGLGNFEAPYYKGDKRVPVQWEKFESTMGFSCDKHILDFFSKVDINEAKSHKAALEKKQDETSAQLQGFVTKNYTKFIHISNEIMNIESDMNKLTTMLGDTRKLMKQLQKTSFDVSDFRSADSTDDRKASFSEDDELPMYTDIGKSNSQQIEDLCEEVGILVYQCKYAIAVTKIVQARKILKAMEYEISEEEGLSKDTKETRTLQAKFRRHKNAVEAQVRTLVSALLSELKRDQAANNTLSTSSYGSIRVIQYLIRLGRSEEGLDILLKTRSASLRTDVRAIKFQGDAPQYVKNLSQVVFRGIFRCIDEFRQIFNANYMMSAVMQWVISELEDFVAIFSTQVFEARSNFGQLSKCIHHAFEACTHLAKGGLNLSFVLARRLLPIVQEVIKKTFDRITTQLVKHGGEMSKETWLTRRFTVREPGNVEGKRTKKEIKLTDSTKYLYNVVRTLLEADLVQVIDDDILPYATVELYSTVANEMVKLLNEIITYQAKTTAKYIPSEREDQHLSILANFQYLLADLLPRMQLSLRSLFKCREVIEVKIFEDKLKELSRLLLRSFCKRRAELWAQLLRWDVKSNTERYGIELDEEKMSISDEMVQVLERMYKLKDLIHTHLKKEATRHIMRESIELLFRVLADPRRMQGVKLTHGGMQQLYLDTSFLLKATETYITKPAVGYANEFVKRCQDSYCKSSGLDIDEALNDEMFFEAKLADQFNVTVQLMKYESHDSHEKTKKRRHSKHTSGASAPKPLDVRTLPAPVEEVVEPPELKVAEDLAGVSDLSLETPLDEDIPI